MAVQISLKQAAVAVPVTPPPDVLLQVERQHGLWHRGVHFVASEVRDYELDQFQVRQLLLLLYSRLAPSATTSLTCLECLRVSCPRLLCCSAACAGGQQCHLRILRTAW